MNQEYRRTNTTVSKINYHFVFCPHFRRKIFLNAELESFFKETVTQICEQNNIEILAMECQTDHCHLFLNAPPTLSPADIMKLIKGGTGYLLRQKYFPYMRQLWTRSYFVSTAGDVSSDTIQRYVETQKKRS